MRKRARLRLATEHDLVFDHDFGVWRHESTGASCPPVEVGYILGDAAERAYGKTLMNPERVRGLLLARYFATWAFVSPGGRR